MKDISTKEKCGHLSPVIIIILVFLSGGIAPTYGSDLLDSLLARLGWSTDSLGFTTQARWNRMPDAHRLPYLLPFFPELWRYPRSIYAFAHAFPAAAQQYLAPTYRNAKADGVYKTTYFVAVDRWITGFRPYSANIITTNAERFSTASAFRRLWQLANRLPYRPPFGGQYVDTTVPWGPFVRQLDSLLPQPAISAFALFLHNLVDALHWYKVALRNTPANILTVVTQIDDLHRTQGDGNVYYPAIDDAFASIDWHSFLYAAMKCIATMEWFVHTIDTIPVQRSFQIQLSTPFGAIILCGAGNDTIIAPQPLCIIDFGGNDDYHGNPAGASAITNPIALSIDLDGNDRYNSTQRPAQGAAILGIGILWDHRGHDRYQGKQLCQGSAQLGFGALIDEHGNDYFAAEEVAQGAGLLGIGLLFDLAGNDHYSIYGNGQGDGEFGGIGILIDYYGNDTYYAEPWAAVFDRGDYHSNYRVNASNAQGFGGGRRGDGSDGHSWAGGLGVLVDLAGNDRYTSGNWSLGTGYWFGIGLLIDQQGDDHYRSCYFTQGSGAHFAIGGLIDEQGNDHYELFETMGAAFAFGWDFTIAMFIDRQGNDTYKAKTLSFGVAQICSQTFFLELAGNDVYGIDDTTKVFGIATPYRYATNYSPTAPYFYWARSLGLFLDLRGQDRYYLLSRTTPLPFRNNTRWRYTIDTTGGGSSISIGIDRPSGTIHLIHP